MLIPLIVLPLTALLIAIASQLGGDGRIRRNGMIGIRIPSTMSSEAAWKAGHRAATVPAWIGFGATTTIAIAVSIAVGLTHVSVVALVILLVVVLAAALWSTLAAQRAARAVSVD